MTCFVGSVHIPVNWVSFFPGFGKSYEQGITTQDPGRPLTEDGTLLVQDAAWETGEENTEDNMFQGMNTVRIHKPKSVFENIVRKEK